MTAWQTLAATATLLAASNPANRIGFAGGVSLAQLKILQEVITLAVFVPFAMLYFA